MSAAFIFIYVEANFMETLRRLQRWYKSQCDGDWEHSFGIKIQTLDNPGWTITIDLEESSLESLELNLNEDNGEFDWYFIKASDKKYEAAGDPDKLDFLIKYFLDDVLPNYSNDSVHYDILIPIEGGPAKIWTPCKAIQVDEETFEIKEIPALDYKAIQTQSLDDLTFGEKELMTFKVTSEVGDKIKTELVETFDGIKVAKKQS